MTRRLLNLLTALSLLLYVAVCVLWVRSLRAADTWMWERTTAAGRIDELWIDSGDGRVGLWSVLRNYELRLYSSGDDAQVNFTHTAEERRPAIAPDGESFWNRIGFSFKSEHYSRLYRGDVPFTYRQWWVALPLWLPAAITACLPAARLARWRLRRRRFNKHLCHACGYDIRATPGRCPECGTVASVPTTG